MSEIDLDVLTYEKIMDFALLDPCASDYYEKVLSLLKTNFAGSLTAYTSWYNNDRLESYYSIGFSDEFMRQAHNIYIHDEIRNFALEQVSSNSWDGIFYSQDMDPFTFSGSTTIAYLNENHIHYFAIAVLSRSPRINLILCKTDKEGPFTKRERTIIQKVYKLVCRQVQIRETHNTDRHALEVIGRHCLNKKTGLIITDEERAVLSYNEAVLSLVPKTLNPKSVDDIAAFVFSLFEKKENDAAERDENELSVTQNGRIYTLETIKLLDEAGKQSQYSLITIRRKNRFDNKVDLTVSAEYGLTEREYGIAELLVSGHSNYEIADQLHISVHTVKIHVSNLFRKLNVHSRMEAIMKLIGKG